jgi:hypothetical protein
MKSEIPNPHLPNFTSYFLSSDIKCYLYGISYLAIWHLSVYLVRHHAEIGEPDGEGRLAALTVLPEARPDPIKLRIIRQGRIYKQKA